MSYKCMKVDFPELEKKVKRICKKLDKYNLNYNFEVISESIEEVDVIDYTNYNNVPSWQFHPKYCGKIAVDVVYYDFTMDRLQLGDYEVIAVLEHGENGNLIHIIKEEISIPEKYRNIKSICEHCNSNRMRNKTVLLQDSTGDIKQVGTTCIKEYTGIDAVDIIAAYQEIHDIIIDNGNMYIDSEYSDCYPKYEQTVDYLTACIQLINEKGYDKETTKYKAWEMVANREHDIKYKETAEKVINYFADHDFTDNFLNNIKVALSNQYCKISGLIAYAYISYKKQLEYDKKKQAEEEQKALSQYVGKVGEKIRKTLTLVNRYSYETFYNLQYIYIFKDSENNTYIWKTENFLEKVIDNKCIAINIDDQIILQGTIKAHEEYRGEKQTVLTRCKVIG